eukprot:1036897-Rhodomonas_salina.1
MDTPKHASSSTCWRVMDAVPRHPEVPLVLLPRTRKRQRQERVRGEGGGEGGRERERGREGERERGREGERSGREGERERERSGREGEGGSESTSTVSATRALYPGVWDDRSPPWAQPSKQNATSTLWIRVAVADQSCHYCMLPETSFGFVLPVLLCEASGRAISVLLLRERERGA